MLTVDYNYITSIFPDVKRRQGITRKDWLNLLISSLKKGYDNFVLDFNDYKYVASHTGQILSLQNLLNTVIDGLNGQIVLLDGDWLEETYIYILNEAFIDEETYIFEAAEAATDETYLYTEDEFLTAQDDMIVSVSSLDADKEDEIRYYINLYYQAGKTYRIEFY